MTAATVKRALISVSNKEGVVELGQGLAALGVEVISSGGTANTLAQAGVPVVKVSDYTGAPEVLGGRVKTLHPKVHAGILADRRQPEHLRELEAQGYGPIDLVVCNLYPFQQKQAEGADHATLVETIDIGGPTLVRAAAKNADGGVTVVVDPADYPAVLDALRAEGGVSQAVRRRLCAKAFRHVASYDLAIAAWAEGAADTASAPGAQLPNTLPAFRKSATLRYGENPHQAAALYIEDNAPGGVALGEQLSGKALSYNNYLDLDAAYRAAYTERDVHLCAVLKHTNPCGLAEHSDQAEAFRRALAGDPVSAFGSILGFNRPLEGATAAALVEAKLFVECVVAPGFSPEARQALAKKKDLRLVQVPPGSPLPRLNFHRIGGGVLVQQSDAGVVSTEGWSVVTKKQLEPGWMEELQFAMQAAALLKSNAIAVTKGRALLGAGTGQMSRVDAAEHAIKKAGEAVKGAFMGSDAFFPFDDCVRLAATAGIVAIAQPGGSKRDEDSIRACDELGLSMVFTGGRHFRH